MKKATVVGAAVAILAVGIGLPAVAKPAAQATTPEARIDRWIEASGGMESYWSFEGARYTLTTEIYDGDSGRLRRTRPRYVTIARIDTGEAARIERWEGNDFIQHGFDGERVWAVMNGEPLGPGDKDYDEALYVARDVFYWMSLPFKLKDPGVFLHDDGMDEKGRHVVRVTFGEDVGEHDDTWFYWFEDGKTVPVSIAYREEGRDNLNYLRWEDIQETGGYVFGGRRVHYNERGITTKVLAVTEFELNPEIQPSLFREP